MSRYKKKNHGKDDDDQFEQFLRESVSSEESSIDTARVMNYLDPQRRREKSWMDNVEEEDDEDELLGLTGTGNKFMKKKTGHSDSKSTAKNTEKVEKSVSFSHEVGMSKDSLDDESLGLGMNGDIYRGSAPVIPALSLDSTQSATDTGTANRIKSLMAGKETLDELADKERFFKNLERSSEETLDYSQMNKDLDLSVTMGSTLQDADDPDNPRHDDRHSNADSEGNSPQITAIRKRDQPSTDSKQSGSKGSDDDRQTMLSKVALLDSLDSTLGTKPAASRETGDSADMQTIPEGTREEDVTTDDHRRMRKTRFEDEEGTAGHRADMADSTTGRGVTLKTTGTGLAYTDTSREIEALHQALQQVGMGTLDDTRDLTLINSSTQRTHDTSGRDGTGVFGLHPVAPPRTGERSRRTVEDIMREVEELTGNSNQGLYTPRDDQSDYRGFALSPAHSGTAARGVESYDEADQGYDLSPTDKFLPQHSQNAGIPPATPPRSRSRTRVHHSPDGVPIPAKRSVHKDVKTKTKYSHVRGSGYGQRSPSPQRSQTNRNRNWSPAEIQKQKIRGTENINKVKRDLQMKEAAPPPKPGPVSENHLVQSVQSFASYIQDHFSGTGGLTRPDRAHQPDTAWPAEKIDNTQKMAALDREQKLVDEVRTWQEQIQEERKLLAKAKAEQMAVERECKHKLEQQRIDFDQEMFRLKQENYVLSAKVTEDDKSRQRLRPSSPSEDSAGGSTREQEKLLEREVQEQEKLLAGYQQENERLYQEMKKIQKDGKETEQKMFRENQKLSTELANLRETLAQKELALNNKGIITGPAVQQKIAAGGLGPAVLGAGRIAQLEAELKQSKAKEQLLKLEVNTLTVTKTELEQHIEDLVGKIEQFEARLKESNALQSEQTKRKITKLEQELERLNNKLKWYAENQEFLDKDAKLLKRKDEDIYRLKQKIEGLQSESGLKSTEAKMKAKERSQDAKKIQDLERQVKEMENIIRKRHPNSLPVLMWAASGAARDTENKAPSSAFLEKQMEKLRTELEAKDDDGKKSLRVLEQKYNAMKFQYEERIQGLEEQLSIYQRPGDKKLKEGDHPHTHLSALQRELDSVKDRHRKKQTETEAEVDRLKKELSAVRIKENALKSSESKTLKECESELNLRVKALQLEVANQDKEKQLLQKTIDHLGQEKQQLTIEMARLAGQTSKAQAGKLQSKLQSRAGKPSVTKPGAKKSSPRERESLDPDNQPLSAITEAWKDKEYQPLVFAGQHVSEILRDNEQLRQKVELLQLDVDQHRVTTQKLLAESEARDRKSHEDTDDKIFALKAAHQADIQRLLADHALHNSTSRVAELQGKLDTQEVVVRHMKEQLSQSSIDRERMSVLQIRETTLEAQVRQLMEELREAKYTHTPEMKHFALLQDKIKHMEERHAQREQELQSIIQHSRAVAHADLTEEIDKWRHIVNSKNHELDKFRSELDAILEVLKELQRQGIVLPHKGVSAGLSYR